MSMAGTCDRKDATIYKRLSSSWSWHCECPLPAALAAILHPGRQGDRTGAMENIRYGRLRSEPAAALYRSSRSNHRDPADQEMTVDDDPVQHPDHIEPGAAVVDPDLCQR